MYNPEAVHAAFLQANDDRNRALAIAEQNKARVQKDYPALQDITAQLGEIGASIAKAFFSENPQQSIDALARQSLSLQQQRKALLLAAGLPADFLEPHFHCPKCEDTGRVDDKICDCIYERAVRISLDKLAQISPAKKCSFENFNLEYFNALTDKNGKSVYQKAKNNLDYLKAYSEDFSLSSKNLYIFGRTGLGKTHLTLAAANAIIRKGYDVLYGMAGAIFSGVEAEKFKGITGPYTMQKLLDADLLIIDDLGSEFHTSFTASVVHNIIESRLLASKPVIITTNLDISGIHEQYGERIASRIIGEYEPIKFEGEDIRQLKRFQY